MMQSQEDYRANQHNHGAQFLNYPIVNSTHDLNKQITSVPSGIYPPNSGVMPGAQHHQPNMSGPAPSMIQSQMNHRMIQSFQTRPNPQSMAGMPRSMGNVPQGVAQPSQSYVPNIFSQQHQSIHPMPQQMVYSPQVPVQYQQRVVPYHHTQQIPFFMGTQNVYSGPPNPAFYTTMQPLGQALNSMPISQPTSLPKREKKILQITDPHTGKVVLLGPSPNNNVTSTTESSSDNAQAGRIDSEVCMEFAARVAAVATKETTVAYHCTNDSISDSITLEQQELDTLPETGNGELLTNEIICDPYIDEGVINSHTNSSLSFSKEDRLDSNILEEIPIVEDSKDVYSQFSEPDHAHHVASTAQDEMVNMDISNPDYAADSCYQVEETIVSETIQPEDAKEIVFTNSNAPESEVSVSSEDAEVIGEPNVINMQSITTPSDVSLTGELVDSCPNLNVALEKEKAIDGKRSKSKKKKELNKKGESKEGSEMDAFCMEAETVLAAPEVQSSVLVPASVQPSTSPQPCLALVNNELQNSVTVLENNVSTLVVDENNVPEVSIELVTPDTPEEEKIEDIEQDSPAQKLPKYSLKYNYKEDQWSPLNPEGKKQYDRQFLLELQLQPMSLKKPSNLPNLDVIKDQAQLHKLADISRVPMPPIPTRIPSNTDIFMPQYAKGGPPRPPHPGLNRRSQQGREKPKKVIAFSSSLNQTIKLHESENAWKPSHKSEAEEAEDVRTQDLYKKVRGILNKLTPQKFLTLVTQVKDLHITTEEHLNGVIDLVFEKAIDEPNFSVSYANMCKELARLQVPLAGQEGFVNFRKLLLTKCQKEFEQDRSEELQREKKMKIINDCDTAEKKKQLQDEYDEEDRKIRRRQLGNIRFIGEVFKLNMLTEPIMQDCLRKLLSQGDEESLECLCRLLTTIGKELESRKELMDMNISEMQKIVDKRQTSSRVRFMLQDVIDLRKRNWVPRRDDNNPKTIDQIHKEAEREAHDQQQMLQNMPFQNKRPDDRRKSAASGRNVHDESGGWQSSNKGKGSLDTSKLRQLRANDMDTTIQLGPCGGGGKGYQSWGRGSIGGNKIVTEVEKPTAIHTNRYSILEQTANISLYENRRGSQRSAASSRESSRGRNNQMPAPMKKTPSITKERERLIEDVNKFVGAQQVEQKAPEVQLQNVNGKEPSAAYKTPDLLPEEIEKQTRTLVDEFLLNNDINDTKRSVLELASPNTMHIFITAAINHVLERSSQARCSIGRLLLGFVESETITMEQYNASFKTVLEVLDDYAVDFPKIWEYLAEIIEPIVESKLSSTVLKDLLRPCIPSLSAGRLLSAILHCLAQKRGEPKVGEMWKEVSLQWADFLPPTENISEFISNYKLEFTVDIAKSQPSDMPIPEIKKNLDQLLKINSENNVILDWVENHVGEEKSTQPLFVRALVTSVFENAISGSGEKSQLNQLLVKERTLLLTQYVSQNEESQLQALYALQALMNQLDNPKGMLKAIFNSLYDEDIITEEDVFQKWSDSTDPGEQEGKGVAIACVASFFTWLRGVDDVDSAGEEG